jgi:hypothetical protein
MSNKDDAGRGDKSEPDEAMLDQGWDRWLNRQLHRLYDPVLAEAVPDRLMRLLEQFETSPADDPDDDDGQKER